MCSFSVFQYKMLHFYPVLSHRHPFPRRSPPGVFRIRARHTFILSQSTYQSLVRILGDIKDRYLNVKTLCRIYSVKNEQLAPLYSLSESAMCRAFVCLLDQRPAEDLFYTCQQLKIQSLTLFQRESCAPIRRKLMLRDIADEFSMIANDLTALASLRLWKTTVQRKN